MPKIIPLILISVASLYVPSISWAQDSTALTQTFSVPDKLLAAIDKKTQGVEEKIDKQTASYLAKFQKQEIKLKKKLWQKDSALSKQLFERVEEKYTRLKKASQQVNKYGSVYSGHMDSLITLLKFLNENKLGNLPELQKNLDQFSSLQGKFNQVDQIQKYILERSQQLKAQFERLGMVKEVKSFQKQAYYYSAQIREYKEVFENPSKLEAKLMEVVLKVPQFKDFFQKNSQLGSLFSLPGTSDATSVSLSGLQTRASVNQSLVDRFGAGANTTQMLQQNIQAAQGQLNQLKNKLNQYSSDSYGNSSSDVALPEGFKPNNQKVKSLWGRLEWGSNVQTTRGSSLFPVTSDFGMSIGYKLHDKSSVAIGASYKLGWGSSWRHIKLTHQGVGLRCYVDYKLKGSLYISGGYEQNYRSEIHSIYQFKNQSAWQASGLVGLSKKYQVSKKIKGNMQVLWDFLSYQQVPKTQPVVFRVGYTIK